jgi:hypothetical protein
MSDKQLWIDAAEPKEQGSFCDTGSRAQYQNVDGFGAVVASQEAETRGNEVRPIVSEDINTDSVDQRYNLFHTETDEKGTITPAQHRVGGV